ncbi:UNKNOWN [Stylonychia lemnae]|uniref:Acyltransferase 3 domain-containing protein n=1 Tax=Stylonychia lemnae TaxID=5949 RepID=A0A077ZQZ6_STYLE|nr:UNKNOWN [Stylonychia lemnae]|eukprot:CDW71869.1 UNKNOWN [Stylonychia lemnae]
MNNNNELQFFDLIKAIGAFIVYFGHTLVNHPHMAKITPAQWTITVFGAHQTNDAFFFISGWLSIKSFESSIKNQPNQSYWQQYWGFTSRRIYRMAPLFYLIGYIQHDFYRCTWKEFFHYITFTHQFYDEGKISVMQKYWYVNCQMLLLIGSPLMFMLGRQLNFFGKNVLYIIPAAVILFQAPNKLVFTIQDRTAAYFLGILSYHYSLKMKDFNMHKYLQIFILIICFLVYPLMIYKIIFLPYNLKPLPFLLWIVIFTLVAQKFGPTFFLNKLAKFRVVQIVSSHSFELYMIQSLYLFKYQLFEQIKENYRFQIDSYKTLYGVSIASFLITLMLSKLVLKYFEMPILSLCMNTEARITKYFSGKFNKYAIMMLGFLIYFAFDRNMNITNSSRIKDCGSLKVFDDISFNQQMKQYELQVLENFQDFKMEPFVDNDAGLILREVSGSFVRKQSNDSTFKYQFNDGSKGLDIYGQVLFMRGHGALGLFNQTLNNSLQYYPFTFQARLKDYIFSFELSRENQSEGFNFVEYRAKQAAVAQFKPENNISISIQSDVSHIIMQKIKLQLNKSLKENRLTSDYASKRSILPLKDLNDFATSQSFKEITFAYDKVYICMSNEEAIDKHTNENITKSDL